jgi:hypothetical protein
MVFIIDINSRDFKNYKINYTQKMKNITNICLNNSCKQFVIFLFGLRYNFSVAEENHMNSIIIDKKKKNILIFDPWGKTKFYDEMLQIYQEVKKIIFEEHNEEYKYLDYKHFNKQKSFQILEAEKNKNDYPGYCFFWNLWFIESILMNPNLDIKTIINQNLKYIVEHFDNFLTFIRSYVAYIDELYKDLVLKLKVPEKIVGDDFSSKMEVFFEEKYKEYLRNVSICRLDKIDSS